MSHRSASKCWAVSMPARCAAQLDRFPPVCVTAVRCCVKSWCSALSAAAAHYHLSVKEPGVPNRLQKCSDDAAGSAGHRPSLCQAFLNAPPTPEPVVVLAAQTAYTPLKVGCVRTLCVVRKTRSFCTLYHPTARPNIHRKCLLSANHLRHSSSPFRLNTTTNMATGTMHTITAGWAA